jgi:hypothetical protein
MAKTIEDFKEDLRLLRAEMYQNGENVDTRMLGSFIDRLVISLEAFAETMESVDISVETLSDAEANQLQVKEAECGCQCCCMEEAPKKKAPAKKAAKKKPAKKAKKKSRR